LLIKESGGREARIKKHRSREARSKEVKKQESEKTVYGRRLTVCGGWKTYFLLKKLEDRE
jgi:uncharacterized protein with ACT and thioredoxin-like domain